jgi:hypothetical protein
MNENEEAKNTLIDMFPTLVLNILVCVLVIPPNLDDGLEIESV